MKKQSLILQEQRGVLDEKRNGILADIENRDTKAATDAEMAELRSIRTQMEELQAKIDDAKFLEEEQRSAAQSQAAQHFNITGPRNKEGEEGEKRNIRREFSFVKAIGAMAEGRQLEGREKELHEEGSREALANKRSIQGLAIPAFMIAPAGAEKRAQSVGTATQSGDFVETQIGLVSEYLYPRTVLTEMGATYWNGLTSNVDIIRQDGPAVATWEGENDDNANTDPTIESVPLRPKRLGAQVVVGKQLMFQTKSISVENWLRNNLNKAQGVALETAAFNGSGVSPIPEGLLNITGIGDLPLGTDGAVPTWGNIVGLETLVAIENADFGRLAYVTHPTMRGVLKTTKKDAGSGIFLWENDMMNGYRAFCSNVLPNDLVKGSSDDCMPIIFGNWEELYIGQWDGLDIVVDIYTLAKKAQIAITVNGWYDLNVGQLGAFAAIQDAVAS